MQGIGLYSFGEGCAYGCTARNEVTASSDVESWVELDSLTPFAKVQKLSHLSCEMPPSNRPSEEGLWSAGSMQILNR